MSARSIVDDLIVKVDFDRGPFVLTGDSGARLHLPTA
jgi:hypothetical protein